MKKEVCKSLSYVLVAGMILGGMSSPALAAKKNAPKLSPSKATIKVGKKKTIKVKNTSKKAKWSVKSGKKNITLSKKKKKSVVVKGKKAGKAVVLAKIGKKKLTCKITVTKKADVKTTPAPSTKTNAVTASNSPAATQPATTQPATAGPATTEPATTEPGGGSQTAEAVQDIVIDMTKVGTTTFTSAPAMINFSSQLDSRFDLGYFKEVRIGYELVFEGEDTSKLTGGKLAIAGSEEQLDGYYDDDVTLTYDMMPGTTSATISLSGKTGKAAGINVQPMDKAASYGWPETLKSVTITSIQFIAKANAVYPAPGSATPTPTPTVAPEFESSEFKYEGLDEQWIEDNIDPSKPVVAMSFDDGPGGYSSYVDYGTQIQEALKAAGAHATFFYMGQNIVHDEESRQEVENAWKAGFEVANHSYDSAGLNGASADVIKEKIAKTDALLSEITGYSNFLFRAPNVAYSDTMYKVIEKPFIDVSIWSNDYQSSVDEDAIVTNVINGLKDGAGDGGIINMHSVHEKTANAVPRILEWCKENDYQVVSVSELFAIKGKKLMTGEKYYNAK